MSIVSEETARQLVRSIDRLAAAVEEFNKPAIQARPAAPKCDCAQPSYFCMRPTCPRRMSGGL
jgi:hypothetical protein